MAPADVDNDNQDVSLNSKEQDPEANRDDAVPPPSSWRGALVGDYDWGFLCMPRVPFRGRTKLPPFYSKDEKIPLLLALVMGLQHALAMVGGIITAPLIIASTANFSAKTEAYLVSSSLIVTSVASFIQVYQVRIPFTNYVIGSGLLSVMGVSFGYIPVGTIY